MATFPENLSQIANAVYGREVRQAMKEGLQQTWEKSAGVQEDLRKLAETVPAIDGTLTRMGDAADALVAGSMIRSLQADVSQRATNADLQQLQEDYVYPTYTDVQQMKAEKADKTDVTALQQTVAQKAEQSELQRLAETVPSVDSTLTVGGGAADAAVVGAALYQLNYRTGALANAMDQAQTDLGALQTAVDGKQETLIAGSGIEIAADGKTISATGGGQTVDVQVNGVSVKGTDGVANVPIATNNDLGVVKILNAYGIAMYDNGRIGLSVPGNPEQTYTKRSELYAVTMRNYDDVVRHAMCDGKGAEWTANERAAARKRINGEWVLKGTIDGGNDLSVDLTDCTEFVIKGNAKSLTGNVLLICNISTLIYNLATTTNREFYASWRNGPNTIEAIRACTGGASAYGVALTNYTFPNKSISDITKISWATPNDIDSVTHIEIWAR